MSDFDQLQPQVILRGIELAGFRPTGEYAQLNSYENRVFDVRLEAIAHAIDPIERVIAKFYRPRRWSVEAVRDEHEFLHDLNHEGIAAIAPLMLKNGTTTLQIEGYVMSLFPRVLGRMPDEFLPGQLRQVGRMLARIHNVGARRPAKFRPSLTTEAYGWPALERLEQYVYPELWRRYEETAISILQSYADMVEPGRFLRIHGDCHKGNLLHNGKEFFIVDFDDFCNGPEVQDFWMLLSGSLSRRGEDSENDIEILRERDEIITGYEELRDIPDDWFMLDALRGLRIIHYGGWIAQRWNDPFFKRIFPDFTTYNYWLDELNRLEAIAAALA